MTKKRKSERRNNAISIYVNNEISEWLKQTSQQKEIPISILVNEIIKRYINGN